MFYHDWMMWEIILWWPPVAAPHSEAAGQWVQWPGSRSLYITTFAGYRRNKYYHIYNLNHHHIIHMSMIIILIQFTILFFVKWGPSFHFPKTPHHCKITSLQNNMISLTQQQNITLGVQYKVMITCRFSVFLINNKIMMKPTPIQSLVINIFFKFCKSNLTTLAILSLLLRPYYPTD